MLKSRIKRRAAEGANAINRLAQIETAVMALNDEDLLDLADIFRDAATLLNQIASREMTRRNISL